MFLRQELPSLLQRAGLLEREGARECVAQLFEPRKAIATRAAAAGYRIQIADELLITAKNGSRASTVQVRPDGTFLTPLSLFVGTSGRTATQPDREIVAVGRTTAQLQHEIATILATRNQSPEVFVILVSPRSREDLRREFDSAWKAAEAWREPPP
jgi:protein involved in polysaccharide export with SLBB domain